MIAKKPPMGWNSWNTFGDKINEQLIKEMADRSWLRIYYY